MDSADAPAQLALDFPDVENSLPPALTVAAPVLVLALSACGSEGMPGDGPVVVGTGGASDRQAIAAPVTSMQASRFLAQATMGATSADIADVQSRGYDQWLTSQFAMTRAQSHWDWLVANGYNVVANKDNTTGFDNMMWRQLIVDPGQLQQRVGMALLELMVVGIEGVQLNWKQFAMAAYVDILLDNAFGNFRDIMGKITTNAAMASFLTFLGNKKANANSGSVPDENYARELMQLFTMGLYALNQDGTQRMNGATPAESYSQADVSGLARVFTGLNLDSSDSSIPDRYRRPLIVTASQHEMGVTTFLGTTIAAGTDGMTAVNSALDTIFNNANVPPFVSRQLIMKLVTSNPTPAYVNRVAAKFIDNGSGVRGDMKAVIRAILLDTEARADPVGTTGGKLREPVMRLTGWARAFKAASTSDTWTIGDTSSTNNRLGQSMGRSASVFNFFRPGYSPPNTPIAAAGLVAPEFQITNELSVVAYVNFMQSVVSNTVGDVKATYDELTTITDSQALVDKINEVLAAGQISATTRTAIKTAVDSVSNATNKIYTAVLLTMASPEYLTLK